MKESPKDHARLVVPHPIPYQGSKRNLAPIILSYFPPKFSRLVEPFAGSAAVSLAKAYRGLAKEFLLNDAHRPVADLWREIIQRPAQLAQGYDRLWLDQEGCEREFYDLIRDKFNKTHRPDYFLYLLARCVKAAIRYNSDGQFNNSPDNRRKGAKPGEMRRRIIGASRLFKTRSKVTNLDYREVLEDCTCTDLIYMDPPYQGVCGKRDARYAPKVDHFAFCQALAELNERGCMYIVSYDGRMGTRIYGERLPASLCLQHIEVHAGRSTQATLLGRQADTYESLYLSPALLQKLKGRKGLTDKRPEQLQFAW